MREICEMWAMKCFPCFNQPGVRICVPVPLYHCFGSVLGGMSMAVHGVTLVFPGSTFNAQANLEAIQSERYDIEFITTVKLKMYNMHIHCLHLFIVSQGAISSMALPQCSSTCSANRICESMICHRLNLVRSFKVKTRSYWIWCDVQPSFEASLSPSVVLQGSLEVLRAPRRLWENWKKTWTWKIWLWAYEYLIK